MPRLKPRTIVANSLAELEDLNRLMAAGEPDFPDPSPDPTKPPQPEPDEDDDDEDPDTGIPDGDEPLPEDDPDEDEEAAATPAASAARTLQVQKSWRYPGFIPPRRPSFIDPSWIAYLSYDEATQTPAGPALRVPTPSGDKYARPGDYVVLQTSGSSPAYVDVWQGREFERFFGKQRRAA